MAPRFLDTNVLLRYLTLDNEDMAAAALHLLARIERAEEHVATSQLVIFETVFTLQRTYKLPRENIRGVLLPIIAMRSLQVPDKQTLYHSFDLYVELNIPFADAYNAAYMLAHGFDEVYSWDRDFDRVEGVSRVEPSIDPDLNIGS